MNLQCLYEAQIYELVNQEPRNPAYTHISEIGKKCKYKLVLQRLYGYPRVNMDIKRLARMKQGERSEITAVNDIIRWSRSPLCKEVFPKGLKLAMTKDGLPMLDTHIDKEDNPNFHLDKSLQLGGRVDAFLSPVDDEDELIIVENKHVSNVYFNELMSYYLADIDLFPTFFDATNYPYAKAWPSQACGYGVVMGKKYGTERIRRLIFSLTSDYGLSLQCLVTFQDHKDDMILYVTDTAMKVKDAINGNTPLDKVEKTEDVTECFDCGFYMNKCQPPILEKRGDTDVLYETDNPRLKELLDIFFESEPTAKAGSDAYDEIKEMLRPKIEKDAKPGTSIKRLVIIHGIQVLLEMRWHKGSNPKPRDPGFSFYCIPKRLEVNTAKDPN